MTALPRIRGSISAWRARRDSKVRHKQNASYEQRNLVLATCRDIRRATKEERREKVG